MDYFYEDGYFYVIRTYDDDYVKLNILCHTNCDKIYVSKLKIPL